MRKVAGITAIVVGVIMAVAGMVTWVVIGNTLADQKIVVSADADCLAGDDVNGPFSAYCQAMVINKHTMGITGGKTYAELAKDDPNRATAMDCVPAGIALHFGRRIRRCRDGVRGGGCPGPHRPGHSRTRRRRIEQRPT